MGCCLEFFLFLPHEKSRSLFSLCTFAASSF